ncbi:MAG: hypothetical protein RR847_02470 [Bacilli bacterium]
MNIKKVICIIFTFLIMFIGINAITAIETTTPGGTTGTTEKKVNPLDASTNLLNAKAKKEDCKKLKGNEKTECLKKADADYEKAHKEYEESIKTENVVEESTDKMIKCTSELGKKRNECMSLGEQSSKGKACINQYNEKADNCGSPRYVRTNSESVNEDKQMKLKNNCSVIDSDFGVELVKILSLIRIAGVILTILLGIIDFVRSLVASDDDAMKKCKKRFLYRLIALVALFLIPVVIEMVLGWVVISGVDYCKIEK